MKKDWRNVEKTFLKLGIDYKLKDWLYWCKVDNREFYYSPQRGKWKLKGNRAWQQSQSTVDFINQAKNYSPPDRTKYQQNKTSKKSGTKNRKNKQNTHTKNQNQAGNNYEVRALFLHRFEQHLLIQRERNYKIGWIWRSLMSNFKLTAAEICWLSVVFDYSPWWAYYQIDNLRIQISREEVFKFIDSNRSYWLRYFQTRWGGWKEEQTNSSNKSTTKAFHHQYHLEILQLSFPFTKEELKSAYRRKSLETHPDTGGTAEAFRKVNNAYQVLSRI